MTPDQMKIYDAIKTRFLKEGFYKTSMDELAADLRISKKTIYKHFSSKEEIINLIVVDIQKEVKGKIKLVKNNPEDAVQKALMLTGLLSSFLLTLSEKWIKDLRIHYPDKWKEIEKFRDENLLNTLAGIIGQGKKEELFEDLPAEIILPMFIGSISSVIDKHFLIHSSYSFRDAVTITFRILFKGILTTKGLKKFNKSIEKVKHESF